MAFALRRGIRFPAVPTVLLLLFGVCWFLTFRPVWTRDSFIPSRQGTQAARPKKPAVEVVMASMKYENTSWVQTYLPDWSHRIYHVDDPTSPLTVKVNKGHEAMVYLTHIIDAYDNLADTTVFMHAGRFQWHNDDPDYDAVPALQRLNTDYVQTAGYANLRCVLILGCPVEIRPWSDELPEGEKPEGALTTKQIYKRAFQELLPEMEVPKEIGVSCCSQFAVSRDAIRRRPKEDYIRYRQWIIDTPLTDDLSGRVFEYAFHIIFGKKAVYCPEAHDCYCNVFGLCNLTCTERECAGRYTFPSMATLPKGWPLKGWNGEERTWNGLPV